jgi:hypothetical protein
MKVTFEGVPPFQLPAILSATARFSDETVEMTLFLLADGHNLVPVHVPMTVATARTLGLVLSRVAREAEIAKGRG